MQQEIFQPDEYLNPKWYIFKEQRLGQIHETIPWEQLSACLPEENEGPGAPRWFDAKGMFGLMFLKAYFNISDEKLIEQYNTDMSLQFFCGKLLKGSERIKDISIVSRVRSYIANNCDWSLLQEVLIRHWKRDMNNTHVLMMDATCYESYIRFPTDVKLLWESCEWIYEKQIFSVCKRLQKKRPRSKYVEQKRKQLNYNRKRKNSYKEARKRRRALLYLLEKGINQLQEILNEHPEVDLSIREKSYLRTIKKVLEQQTYLEKHPGSSVKDRIVSLPKPYVHPIIRGKENKRVEYGMKAHLLQVDGICLFDKMSYSAFNETTRLKLSIVKHKHWFKEVYQLAADRIYASNSNRKYITAKKIFSSFPQKGPKKGSKSEKQLKSTLSKVRSTALEGSFGIHKVSYGLNKVKARNQKNEMLWVFFGVMTANAVNISKRREKEKLNHCKSAA